MQENKPVKRVKISKLLPTQVYLKTNEGYRNLNKAFPILALEIWQNLNQAFKEDKESKRIEMDSETFGQYVAALRINLNLTESSFNFNDRLLVRVYNMDWQIVMKLEDKLKDANLKVKNHAKESESEQSREDTPE